MKANKTPVKQRQFIVWNSLEFFIRLFWAGQGPRFMPLPGVGSRNPRFYIHTDPAIWMGTEMIIWGGTPDSFNVLGAGVKALQLQNLIQNDMLDKNLR